MHFSPNVEDDRTAYERMRLSQLRELAKENGIDVPIEMTSAGLIPILEGQGVRPRRPSAKSRGLGAEAIEKMRAEIEDQINEMRPSELMALAKSYGVEMSIRMTADEKETAKKALIEKM